MCAALLHVAHTHICTSLPMQTPPTTPRQVNARLGRSQPAPPPTQWTGRGRPIGTGRPCKRNVFRFVFSPPTTVVSCAVRPVCTRTRTANVVLYTYSCRGVCRVDRLGSERWQANQCTLLHRGYRTKTVAERFAAKVTRKGRLFRDIGRFAHCVCA